ncbi:unnamed protein product [Spodoptera exigua]|uniref:Uncharacterized protein n=1 Tax=Spodoptera exigua TaxID=7107 RepID=A0A835GNR6_SPOEX|nr:hypothetical protein HW555_003559 [Spodoptera exigua]CAH0686432.1 unnamed protein product [Spodoptera exigua]
MRADLPVFKRCCFCIPLRYGLLTWAYVKLVTVTIFSMFILVSLYHMVGMYTMYHLPIQRHNIIFMSVILTVLFIEISLTVTFIVGGHMKNVKLMRVFYVYNIVILTISSLLMIIAILMLVFPIEFFLYRTFEYISTCANFFFSIVIQLYFILLIRSEILKLEGKYGFSFVNNAAEGECNMRGDTQTEGDWKTIEDEPKKIKSVA